MKFHPPGKHLVVQNHNAHIRIFSLFLAHVSEPLDCGRGTRWGSMAPLTNTCVQKGTQIGICECTGVESAGFLGRNFLVMSAVSDENLS